MFLYSFSLHMWNNIVLKAMKMCANSSGKFTITTNKDVINETVVLVDPCDPVF